MDISAGKPPLSDMEFVVIGEPSKSIKEIRNLIENMGGTLGTKVHEKLAAVISNQDEVKQAESNHVEVTKSKLEMLTAKYHGIQVVTEDFLDNVKNGGALSYISTKSICEWGTDVNTDNYICLVIL